MQPRRRITRRHVVLGLGANLGDRASTLRTAVAVLEKTPGITVLRRSTLYETEPAGGPPQPDYLNGAVLVATTLSLLGLLETCLAIEAQLGRVRPDPVRWGPRALDLDVLWCAEERSEDPRAVVPHPRLAERAFALRPLLDVAPEARAPGDAHSYAEKLASLVDADRVRRFGEL